MRSASIRGSRRRRRTGVGPARVWPVLVVALGTWAAAGGESDRQTPAERTSPRAADGPTDPDGFRSRRVIHRFDFDERPSGNLEDVPQHWEPLQPPGFPHYTSASFDFETGAVAPPSFHLAGEGRSVAYQYAGPQTRVRANTDYRIAASIRPDQLRHGRACLSAHFIDRDGKPIPDTLVRSRYVGGADDGWVEVELFLASAPRNASTIGLVAWVLHESVWNTSSPAPRHIRRTDVRGGAWFDDIDIFALPRLELRTSARSNVLVPGAIQELWITLADDMDPTIHGRLTIRSAEGELVESRVIPVALDAGVEPTRLALDPLPPGLYHAQLEVSAGSTPIVSRSLTFAKAAALHGRSESLSRAFGVMVAAEPRSDPDTELELLERQVARSAKLPIRAATTEDGIPGEDGDARNRTVHELAKRGFALTGVLAEYPTAILGADGEPLSPFPETPNGDPTAWRDPLGAVVAPTAGAFRWWQIGPDEGAGVVTGDAVRTAATRLREALRPFLTFPRLAMPVALSVEPADERPPVEQVSLVWDGSASEELLASQIARYRALAYRHVSVAVPPLPERGYDRVPRLAEWARRLLIARHTGADTVFAPATWSVREAMLGSISEPDERYLILRTIADLLADATPGQAVDVGEGIRCLAFHEVDTSVLAIWAPNAGPPGRRIALQLGRVDRFVDIWGREAPLLRDERGRQVIELSAVPVLVPGVERWLVDFRASLSLYPDRIEPGADSVRHTIAMSYSGDRPMSGQVTLEAPAGWQVVPRTFAFEVTPRRTWEQVVEVRYPHNETAGPKRITANLSLGNLPYRLEMPLTVEIALSDVDVRGSAVLEDGTLILRHAVTNRSNRVLSFRGSATMPGRERQYRPMFNLLPGDTQEVEYRIPRATGLAGRSVHLLLRELNHGPRVHNLQLLVP